MNAKIDSFKVIKLHGYKNYEFSFPDNTLILVGENGSGKTTVLRLLYYLLSSQWNLLAPYNFKEISISINHKEHTLKHEQLEKGIEKLHHDYMRRLPPPIRNKIMNVVRHGGNAYSLSELKLLCDRYDIPFHALTRQLDLFEFPENERTEIDKLFSYVNKSLDAQILYLPTYRRIEQELNLIFKGIDDDEWKRSKRNRLHKQERSYVELIEFGMMDVVKLIEDTLERLKDFARENLNTLTLGYLGDVVDKQYLKVDINEIQAASKETIHSVLDRIHESILSTSHKMHLFERINEVRTGAQLDEHAKVICHYFLKLLKFQEELRHKESQITNFCTVCNQYMVGKELRYDSASFRFYIESKRVEKGKPNIELQDLSSGEKQIVSLFNHLYLSGEKSFFVIIDEPELSLSVDWQRRFLTDVRRGDFCAGLVAATHSPFIYDNDLRQYAHGLGEFQF